MPSNKEIVINSEEEKEVLAQLEKRQDAEALRMKRFLAMNDLSRDPESPIHEIVERISRLEEFKSFSIIKVPEIVSSTESFDLFDFPANHPARNKSDTYYATDTQILRPHTTVSWYYYLASSDAKEKIASNQSLGVLTYGKVYRKDEIDRNHMNIFHQMDGYYLLPKNQGTINIEDLKKILTKIAQAIFGKDIKYRFNKDTFPYTDPSIEMEIVKKDKWIEVLGSGVVKPGVLEKLGVDSKNYTGWAFGFGLERLAIVSMELPDIRLLWSQDERVKRQLKLGQIYQEVSKYPPITRDISFIVNKSFEPNNYFDLIRDIGGELIEEVSLLDKYEDAKKFGVDKISFTYRIVYRSTEKTLQTKEVEPIQQQIENQTIKQFSAKIR